MTREPVDEFAPRAAEATGADASLIRQALERSAIASCLVAPGGAFVWVNDAMCTFFDRSADKLTRSTWQELTHPDDRTTDQELVDDTIAGGRDSYRLLKRYLRPDGSVVWGDLTASAVRDPSGTVRVFLSQVVDVTDEVVRTERFRLISENSADFIVVSAPDGLVSWISPSVEQVLGWTSDELTGTRFADLVHPHDRDDGFAAAAEPSGRGEPSPPDRFSSRVRCLDGSYRHLAPRTVTVPSTIDDGSQRVDAWRDVEFEAQAYASAVRSSALLTADLDAEMDGRVILTAVRDADGAIIDFEYVEANRAACRALRLTRAEIVGQRLTGLFPEEERTGRQRLYVRVVETGEPEVWEARPMSTRDGAVMRYLDARIVKVLDGVSFAWRDVTSRVLAEQRLAASERELRLLTDSVTDIVAMADATGTITYVSPAVIRILGWTPDDLVGTHSVDLAHPDDLEIVAAANERALAGHAVRAVARIRHRDGGYRWIELAASPAFDHDGTLVGRTSVWRDVTDRVTLDEQRAAAERRLAASEERYRLLAENTADVVILVKDGVVDWISPSVEHEIGSPPADWIGLPVRTCVDAEHLPLLREVLAAVVQGEHRVFRIRGVSPQGEQHWVEAHARPYVDADGTATGITATFRVIDDLIKVEAELDHRARFDELTGLLSRSEVLRRIADATTHTPRVGARTAVLFCDIDHFKAINDEHGHAAGDDVLRAIGERISSVIRGADVAARIGGDELLVLLPGVHTLDDATVVAGKIRDATSHPVTVSGGVEVTPQMSIGVTVMRAGETSDRLVERADDAMYLAKKAGRNRIVAID